MGKPLISVLLPVHNAAVTLTESVQSILCQSFRDFELILIDDGSTDGTRDAIDAFRDPRIRPVFHRYEAGFCASLNDGLRLAEGRYFCMMDAYSVAERDRLDLQFRFMERNPHADIAGSFCTLDPGGRVLRTETVHDAIRVRLLAGQVCCHPTLIVRGSSFGRYGLGYDGEYLLAGDYEFLARASRHCTVVNMPVPLLKYRLHPGRPAVKYDRVHRFFSRRVMLRQLEPFGIVPTVEQADLHFRLMKCLPLDEDLFEEAVVWVAELVAANRDLRILNARLAERFLFGKLEIARTSAEAPAKNYAQ